MTAAYQESREMSKYGGEQERCAIRLHVILVIDATSRFPATEPAVLAGTTRAGRGGGGSAPGARAGPGWLAGAPLATTSVERRTRVVVFSVCTVPERVRTVLSWQSVTR